LRTLNPHLWISNFSHIYIEEEIIDNETVHEITQKFAEAKKIIIKSYKDVFNRNNQNFCAQKNSIKLILAKKRANFIYNGSEMCQNFGYDNFFYTANAMNCIFDCEYCYLKGMYPSANIVVFVNLEDYFKEIDRLTLDKKLYLSISYDTDLLSIENITHSVQKWMDYCRKNSHLTIELRTKSTNIAVFKKNHPFERFIPAWTLSPQQIIEAYEKRTPSLDARLNAIKTIAKNGWKVRICFDPLIYVKNFDLIYGEMIDTVFKEINSQDIKDMSVGTFRISKEYLRRIHKLQAFSDILTYPFEIQDGVCIYMKKHREYMQNYIKDKLKGFVEEEKIFF